MRFRLVPTEEAFFGLFNQAAENAAETARRLREAIDDLPNLEGHHQQVLACERRGDEITDELDDVVDDIYAASDLLVLHQVESPLPEMRDLADTLVQATEATVALISR